MDSAIAGLGFLREERVGHGNPLGCRYRSNIAGGWHCRYALLFSVGSLDIARDCCQNSSSSSSSSLVEEYLMHLMHLMPCTDHRGTGTDGTKTKWIARVLAFGGVL